MPTVAECIWCCEIDTTIQKMGQIQAQISCITEHEGFEPVCLNVWVLQAGYFSYNYDTHDMSPPSPPLTFYINNKCFSLYSC